MSLYNEERASHLEHFGVKGMKWGQRKAGPRPLAVKLDQSRFGRAAQRNVDRSNARARNRQLNKASRKNDRAQNKADRQKEAAKQARSVDNARAKVASGQLKRDWKAAKAQYKKDKIEIGSREARKIRNKVRDKNYETIAKAREDRDTKEFVQRILKEALIETAAGTARSSYAR